MIATTDLKIWYDLIGSPHKFHDKEYDEIVLQIVIVGTKHYTIQISFILTDIMSYQELLKSLFF